MEWPVRTVQDGREDLIHWEDQGRQGGGTGENPEERTGRKPSLYGTVQIFYTSKGAPGTGKQLVDAAFIPMRRGG